MGLPNEAPTADFLFVRGAWVPDAVCAGTVDPELFFSNAKDDVASARTLCADCPVRLECGEQAMLEEGDADITMRYGTRAYMTPAQRLSIHRRGGLKGRDPMLLVQGIDGDREIPPVPDEGDRWSKHHTTLARKVVRWLDDNFEVGAQLPSEPKIVAELGCNPLPLARVLDALVQDGTLSQSRRRRPKIHVYLGGQGVLGSWLPLHLRYGTTEPVDEGDSL